jgi:hypothetical protein
VAGSPASQNASQRLAKSWPILWLQKELRMNLKEFLDELSREIPPNDGAFQPD